MTATAISNVTPIERTGNAQGPHIYTLDTARESVQSLIADMSRRAVMRQHNALAVENTDRLRDRATIALNRVEQQLRDQLKEVESLVALMESSSKLFQI